MTQQRSKFRPIVLIWGLLAASAGVMTAWFGAEDYLLSRDVQPITWYARRSVNKHQTLWYALGLGLAWVFGVATTHFIFDSDQEPYWSKIVRSTTKSGGS